MNGSSSTEKINAILMSHSHNRGGGSAEAARIIYFPLVNISCSCFRYGELKIEANMNRKYGKNVVRERRRAEKKIYYHDIRYRDETEYLNWTLTFNSRRSDIKTTKNENILPRDCKTVENWIKMGTEILKKNPPHIGWEIFQLFPLLLLLLATSDASLQTFQQ